MRTEEFQEKRAAKKLSEEVGDKKRSILSEELAGIEREMHFHVSLEGK